VPSSRRLWHALREVDNYLRGQSTQLVNYAKRCRAGLRVGTSMTEGTAQFPGQLTDEQGATDAMVTTWRRLQVRCVVYNGAFGSSFGYLLEPTSNTVRQSPVAA
jgi:hypothetical protein